MGLLVGCGICTIFSGGGCFLGRTIFLLDDVGLSCTSVLVQPIVGVLAD